MKLALPGSTVGSVRSTEIYYDKTGNIATLCHTVAVSTPTSGSSSLSCAARTYDLSKPGDVVALYAQAIVWLYQFALNR